MSKEPKQRKTNRKMWKRQIDEYVYGGKDMTIYQTVWGHEDQPRGKYHAPIPMKFKGDGALPVPGLRPYYSGSVYHVIVALNGRVFIGESALHPKDNFAKKMGRRIAIGRARRAVSAFTSIRQCGRGLHQVTLSAPGGDEITGLMLDPVPVNNGE